MHVRGEQPLRAGGMRGLGVLAMLACLLFASAAGARPLAQDDVVVLLSQRSGIYEELLDGMHAVLPDAGARARVYTIEEYNHIRVTRPQSHAALVVTVGARAAAAELDRNDGAPVHCALIPAATYAELARTTGRKSSALVLDQPLRRQMGLARLVLPAARRIGVLLGPVSTHHQDLLRELARSTHLELDIGVIGGEKELPRQLTRVLDHGEALLAVADPVVFNRFTAQNILVQTYYQRKPVIGYSHAYVEAGALAAVHSSPAQIGRQLAEQLLEMTGRDDWSLPAVAYPRYFSVTVNRRVAASLGLAIDSDESLAAELARSKEP